MKHKEGTGVNYYRMPGLEQLAETCPTHLVHRERVWGGDGLMGWAGELEGVPLAWVLFGRNDAKAETPVLWPPHAKS